MDPNNIIYKNQIDALLKKTCRSPITKHFSFSNQHLLYATGEKHHMWRQLDDDTLFKAKIVHLILSKETEEAVALLSKHYKVSTPKLKMGMPKRDAKYPACYVAKTATIHFANNDNLYNPFIILHEFYHHLRTKGMIHKGTEKNADNFAKEYITKYHLTNAAFF